MNTIKWELEDLAFGTLFPKRFEEINRLIGEHQPQREALLRQVTNKVQHRPASPRRSRRRRPAGPKHLYSIYQKMIVRGRDFNDIYDLVGVRILVDTVRDCYAALGVIHANWQPVPGRFKDYIAMPKFNMYQSLHTTVIGPTGKPVEMQIRTYAMHRTAEYGIAAHWKYKETKGATIVGPPAHIDEMTWLRQLLDWQREASDPSEFLDALRFDLSSQEVYVFTPKGDVIAAADGLDAGRLRLRGAHRGRAQVHRRPGQRQAGAAGVDAVQRRRDRDLHVEVGDRRPDAGLARLRQEPAGPHQDPAVLQQGAPRGGDRGRQGRDRQGDAQAGPAAAADADRPTTLTTIARDLHLADVAVAVRGGRREPGLGAVGGAAARRRLRRRGGRGRGHRRDRRRRPARRAAAPPAHDPGVVVKGVSDVWIKLARCCTPVPGDAIFGFVTRSGGVSVHRDDCANAEDLQAQPERDGRGELEADRRRRRSWSRSRSRRWTGTSCWPT